MNLFAGARTSLQPLSITARYKKGVLRLSRDMDRQAVRTFHSMRKPRNLNGYGGFGSGDYWTRTSGLMRVKHAL